MERLSLTVFLALGGIGTALVAVALAACAEQEAAHAASEPPGAATPAEEPEAEAEPEEPEDPGPPRRLFAKRFVSNVRDAPSIEAERVGYLRAGAVLSSKGSRPAAIDGEGRRRCEWYELEHGGYVCVGRDVIAFEGERLPEVRATQPDREGKLPYQYGYARRDNTPVYRNLPSDEEAAEFEGYVIPGQPPPDPEAEAAAIPAGIGGSEDEEQVAAVAEAPEQSEATDAEPGSEDAEAQEEEEEEGPPTLASLEGERDSILGRRMMKGFYVSLDRDFRARRRRYWRTQQHEFIPYHWLGLKTGSDFAGIEIDEEQTLPVGWVMSRKHFAYSRSEDGRVRRGRPPGYHTRFDIVDEHQHRGTRYWVAADDTLYREPDITRIDPRPRPDHVAEDEKWIDVDLANQTLVAYEGDRPVFATLVSTGVIVREEVPDLNHATPPGEYRIRAKHLATTMDGDNAFDGPYSIEDVPYVMYYEQGYALHSAFWHDLFGYTKSHGCVNLSPLDAKWIFEWSDPQLPEGWHGVYPTEEDPGTRILIRGETPLRRR